MKDKIIAALAPLTERVRVDVSWAKQADGSQSRTNEPLTPALLAKHLNGGPARGVVPMRPGQSVTLVAVLDFDSHKGETSWAEMQAVVLRVCAALYAAGAHPIAFRSSGGHGIHLYLLWHLPQDAYSVRRWLADLLASVQLAVGAGGVIRGEVEVFPKQNEIAEGRFGNQFILPLAGKSVPLDPFDLNDLPPDWIVGMDWPLSAPVPVLERPPAPARTVSDSASVAVLRSALAAIPDGADCLVHYSPWLDIVHAIHAGTEGSEDGRALAHEFSARSPVYDADEVDEKWDYARVRPDGITVGTLYKAARALGGWTEPATDDFEALVPAPAEPEPLPAFKRDRAGAILATVDNVVLALSRPDVCGVRLGFDTFRDELMLAPAGRPDEWASFTDADYVQLRLDLERGGFKPIGRELMRDIVTLVSTRHRFDSAQLWINSLQWDGVERVVHFFGNYFGAEDSPYTRAVSIYTWTAMAGRVLSPGCQADMVPVLVGPQGIGKTRGVGAMVPAPEHFVGVNLDVRDADTARMLRGVLVGEIGELRGLHTRDSESIKDFISRTHEKWVPKFREFTQNFPRRVVFIGTTNQDEFLADDTGNRRWLPLQVRRCDPARVAADRLQLWAEAAALWLAGGVAFGEAQTLAPEVHASHFIGDAWEGPVQAWLDDTGMPDEGGQTNGDRPFRLDTVLRGALNFDNKSIKRADELRLGRVLRTLGYDKRKGTVDGKQAKVWQKKAGS